MVCFWRYVNIDLDNDHEVIQYKDATLPVHELPLRR